MTMISLGPVLAMEVRSTAYATGVFFGVRVKVRHVGTWQVLQGRHTNLHVRPNRLSTQSWSHSLRTMVEQ